MLMLMMLVILPLTVGLACDTGTPAATTPVATATQPPGGIQVAGSATVASTATGTVQAPSTQPVSCEEAPIATSTPTPTPASTLLPPNNNWDEAQKIEYIESFGFTLLGNWTGAILNNLWEALFTYIGYQDLKLWLNYNLKYNHVVLNIGGIGPNDPEESSGYTQQDTITFYQNETVNPVMNFLHEIGHVVDNLWADYFTTQLEKETFTLDRRYVAGWDGTAYQSLPREIAYSEALFARRAGGGPAWQQSARKNAYSYTCWQQCEDWADIFANSMINNININSDLGGQMNLFFNKMENHVKGITQ